MPLLQEGNATVTTVAGGYGLAIAYGDGSRALDNGMYDTAYANGTDSTSYIGGGSDNISIANGADSITNVNSMGNFVDATGSWKLCEKPTFPWHWTISVRATRR
jgi:hypothetical protein